MVLQKKKKKKKPKGLSFSRRVFIVAWLRRRNIIGLGVSSLILGLCWLLLGSIL